MVSAEFTCSIFGASYKIVNVTKAVTQPLH